MDDVRRADTDAETPTAELALAADVVLSPKNHLILPTTAQLEYLNEGAANIVYTLAVPCIDSTIWDDKLLRLRKNLPTTQPCAVAQEKFEKFIKPLFQDGDLVRQDLVEISSAGILKLLNEELKEWDTMTQAVTEPGGNRRLEKRHGVYLADDKFGLLIDDMSPSFLRGVELIEFKPKWLAQSPSAPRPSKRCRTCAVYARSTALLLRANPSTSLPSHFCPLDLFSKDVSVISRAAKQIIGCTEKQYTTPGSNRRLWRFVNWIQTTTILPNLRKAQELLDSQGVLAGDVNDKDCKLLTAMTLRDVTCYVRYPVQEDAPLDAKIGDLDLKSPEKHAVWKMKEGELIAEGWYEGTEREEYKQPFLCNLYPYERTLKKERDWLVSKRMPS